MEYLSNARRRISFLEGDELPAPLNAIIDLDESALQTSEVPAGLLGGIPFVVKDNIHVKGWASAAGSAVFQSPSDDDAPLIERLRNAGAIPIASANMTEWAAAGSSQIEDGYSERGGLTGNPWALDRSAGTSSSGSAAAVAAGYAPFALGTETIGSLCMPASHCGIYAMKATRGGVPSSGIVPFSGAQDVPGIFARNVTDLTLVMSVLLGRDLSRVSQVKVRVAFDADLSDPEQTDEELFLAFQDFAMKLRLNNPNFSTVPRIEASEYSRMDAVLNAELARDLDQYLRNRVGSSWQSLEDADRFSSFPFTSWGDGPAPRYDLFLKALTQSEVDISLERSAMERYFRSLLENMIGNDDVVVSVAYGPAEKTDVTRRSKRAPYRYHSFLDGISSSVGWPAITTPFIQVDGLPAGLIFVGRPGGEEFLLSAVSQLTSDGSLPTFATPRWRLPRRG